MKKIIMCGEIVPWGEKETFEICFGGKLALFPLAEKMPLYPCTRNEMGDKIMYTIHTAVLSAFLISQ